ncbi:hypothetical protein BCR34DRAFT_213723 [Clohesyomyces aquaticus]|uniref:Uncharacterized protein n=1 Tax=Clohesyomyces aquaticus TaxID=1231657 RepID=A0A1Y1ZX43_9PLEO|nr:hypothetical protein BCR34DRAFT_213723 [Clohesyomyces aquaticus]
MGLGGSALGCCCGSGRYQAAASITVSTVNSLVALYRAAACSPSKFQCYLLPFLPKRSSGSLIYVYSPPPPTPRQLPTMKEARYPPRGVLRSQRPTTPRPGVTKILLALHLLLLSPITLCPLSPPQVLRLSLPLHTRPTRLINAVPQASYSVRPISQVLDGQIQAPPARRWPEFDPPPHDQIPREWYPLRGCVVWALPQVVG